MLLFSTHIFMVMFKPFSYSSMAKCNKLLSTLISILSPHIFIANLISSCPPMSSLMRSHLLTVSSTSPRPTLTSFIGLWSSHLVLMSSRLVPIMTSFIGLRNFHPSLKSSTYSQLVLVSFIGLKSSYLQVLI